MTKVGGVGCKHCKYWQEYKDDTTTELLGVTGSWGRCTNPAVNKVAMTKGEAILATHEREKIRVIRVPEISTIVSTAATWACPHFAMKKEDMRK
jgi:hypothetical protein